MYTCIHYFYVSYSHWSYYYLIYPIPLYYDVNNSVYIYNMCIYQVYTNWIVIFTYIFIYIYIYIYIHTITLVKAIIIFQIIAQTFVHASFEKKLNLAGLTITTKIFLESTTLKSLQLWRQRRVRRSLGAPSSTNMAQICKKKEMQTKTRQ